MSFRSALACAALLAPLVAAFPAAAQDKTGDPGMQKGMSNSNMSAGMSHDGTMMKGHAMSGKTGGMSNEDSMAAGKNMANGSHMAPSDAPPHP